MLLAEEKVKIDDINGLQKINDPAFTKNLHHYDKDLFCVWFALQYLQANNFSNQGLRIYWSYFLS